MPRSYVLMVHGVGKQEAATWLQPWKDALLTALRQYEPFTDKSAQDIERDHLCFVPISYDVVFESFGQRWRSLADGLARNDVIAGAGLGDVMTWVADQDATTQKLFWDYALDAVLWYGFPLARAAVQAKVAEQVMSALGNMVQEGGSGAHLIAHSLGTSVAHDALVGLVASNRLMPDQKRLHSVSMLANTGRLLRAWRDIDQHAGLDAYDPYTSQLRPGPAALTPAYFNFRHQLDPITWPLRFAPRNWSAYRDVKTVNFKDPRHVHDSDHYLANPNVHLPILRAILGKGNLGTQAERQRVWKQFEQSYPTTEDNVFGQLKELLRDPERRMDRKQLAQYLTEAYRVLT